MSDIVHHLLLFGIERLVGENAGRVHRLEVPEWFRGTGSER